MRKGRWISLGLTVGVGVMLGLTSGWVSAQEQPEGSGEVQERGILDTPPPPGTYRTYIDLVPVEVSPDGSCARSASGQLLVPIANLGSTPAPATILRVQFGNNESSNVNVPPINPLSLTIVAVDYPPGCTSQCGFLIRVDASGVVTETGWPGAEQNNYFNVICPP